MLFRSDKIKGQDLNIYQNEYMEEALGLVKERKEILTEIGE